MSTSISNNTGSGIYGTGPANGNAYCSSNQETMATCCNNATLDVDYGHYYCILNRPQGVQGCLQAISDSRVGGGNSGVACTNELEQIQDQDNGSFADSKVNSKVGLGLLILVVVGLLDLGL